MRSIAEDMIIVNLDDFFERHALTYVCLEDCFHPLIVREFLRISLRIREEVCLALRLHEQDALLHLMNRNPIHE